MAGRKRAAEETSTEKRETRSAKVAKTEGTKGKAGAKGTARLKTSMPASKFRSRALPLHVNITHTAPTTAGEGEEPATHADPGYMGSITLVPTSFATGSFGWKASKRIVVELPKEEGEEGEGEKLNVMWTINATVIGSKDVKEGEEHEAEAEGAPHETAGESAESKPEEEGKEAGEEPAAAEEPAATST